MQFKGRAHCFGDNINTDYIISSKRKRDTLDMKELVPYLLETVDPDFSKNITEGDFIVAGANFGCGSSREAAPLIIQASGISAVLAKSFARIFYRNALNCGLPVLELNTGLIKQGDIIEVTLREAEGWVKLCSKEEIIPFVTPGGFAIELIKAKGLLNYIKKNPDF